MSQIATKRGRGDSHGLGFTLLGWFDTPPRSNAKGFVNHLLRNVKIDVSICDSAEFDIGAIPVPLPFLRVMESSLTRSPGVGQTDVNDGSISYRHFGEWVVAYQVSSWTGRVVVTVLRIEMSRKVTASQKVQEKLWAIAKLYSPGAQAVSIALRPK